MSRKVIQPAIVETTCDCCGKVVRSDQGNNGIVRFDFADGAEVDCDSDYRESHSEKYDWCNACIGELIDTINRTFFLRYPTRLAPTSSAFDVFLEKIKTKELETSSQTQEYLRKHVTKHNSPFS